MIPTSATLLDLYMSRHAQKEAAVFGTVKLREEKGYKERNRSNVEGRKKGFRFYIDNGGKKGNGVVNGCDFG